MGLLKYCKLVCLFLLLPLISFGQNINGRVCDKKTGDYLTGALITFYNTDNKILAYTTLNKSGDYSMEYKDGVSFIECSMIGYKKERKPFVKNSLIYNFLMESEAFKLNEVYVKAPAVEKKSDTIIYNIASYASVQDRKLEDVIKRIPGLQVADNGSITYNGEVINKFYIEGGDMLGNNYSLATRNISPKDVKSVEVLENHQPVKSLKKTQFSDKAALNIKLKDDVKSKWIGSFEGVGGYSWVPNAIVYDASFFAMQVGAGSQLLVNAKANNSGKDILSGIDFESKNLANLSLKNAPLDKERTRFNDSYLGSVNLLKKLKKDYELSAKINFGYEKLQTETNSLISYLLKDSILKIYEFEKGIGKLNFINSNLNIKANRDDYYLNNSLLIGFLNSCLSTNFNGSFNVNQKLRSNYIYLKNKFEWIKSYGFNTLSFFSDFKYSTLDEKLLIQNDSIYEQILNPINLDFKNYGEYLIKRDKFIYSIKVNTNLKTYKILNNYGDFDMDFNPSITYKTDNLRANISGLIGFDYYFPFNKNLVKSLLSLNFKYDITPKISLFSLFNMGAKLPNTNLFYHGYILSDYRNLNEGLVYFDNSFYKNIYTYIDYRDPINQLMGKISFNMSYNDNKIIRDNLFYTSYILNRYKQMSNSSESWNIKGELSVGIRFLNGKFTIESYYGKNNSEIIQNNFTQPIKGVSFNIMPTLYIGVGDFINTEIRMKYTSYMIHSTKQKNLSESVVVGISPYRKLDIKLQGEHYANWIGGMVKNSFFIDTYLSYSFKNNYKICCSINNIFNDNIYDYSNVTDLTEYASQYFIRGREIMMGFSVSF